MASNPRVQFTGVGALANSIQQHDLKVKRVIAGQFLYAKDEAVGFAKLNAPWTDRTGNARAGIHGDVKVINQGEAFELLLAHTVYYGIWLEVRFSGRYAILMPTINYIGALLLQRIASSIQKMEALS
ncbi:hypothetical protein HWC80_gp017 [Mycobacterium phage Indlulamithi]|uniref:Minor tail protein n=1 Tax=Mycobacterium phage Indlulamithi TaxID=2656582 RepID=A0A649VCJ6_9CAUD|nr:hypothetical protein HWC80_gp017 [Mycobacterium phage Indlulamithi]QGJ90058.1 hypothetical protein PBI_INDLULAMITHI_17 [Mycobacterium phage Indlulamithi]